MRKLIISLALVLVSSASFSQEAAPSPVSAASAPAAHSQSAAFKAGAWLRGAFTAPVVAGKSFFAGLSSQQAAEPVDAAKPVVPAANNADVAEVPASPASAAMSSVDSALKKALALANIRPTWTNTQAPAPVEDRSIFTSAK